MFLSIMTLLASFVMATLCGLLGAYLAGSAGAASGIALGIVVAFLLMARRVGR